MRITHNIKISLLAPFVAALMISSAASALAPSNVNFFMQDVIRIDLNEGQILLPKLTVTDFTGGNIKPEFGVVLLIEKDLSMLWDKSVAQITVDGLLMSVNYSDDLKKLTIPVTTEFIAGQVMTLEGVAVRAYDRGATYREFEVDVDGDGLYDAKSVNGFTIDETVRRTDSLAPFEITDFSTVIEADKVSIAWTNPLDYDFEKIVMTRSVVHSDGTTDSREIIFGRSVSAYDDEEVVAGDEISYKMQTRDYNEVTSVGLTFSASVEPTVDGAAGNAPTVDGGPEVGTTTPPVTDPVDAVDPDDPVVPAPGVTTSILDSISTDDISDVVSTVVGLTVDSEYVKEVVYLVKSGFIKANYKGSLRLTRQLKYGEFADIVGPALNVEVPGKSRNAYYFAMKDIDGLMDPDVRASHRIRRSDAFDIILKLVGLSASQQTIVEDPESLRWYLKRKELAFWLVGLQDIKSAQTTE